MQKKKQQSDRHHHTSAFQIKRIAIHAQRDSEKQSRHNSPKESSAQLPSSPLGSNLCPNRGWRAAPPVKPNCQPCASLIHSKGLKLKTPEQHSRSELSPLCSLCFFFSGGKKNRTVVLQSVACHGKHRSAKGRRHAFFPFKQRYG